MLSTDVVLNSCLRYQEYLTRLPPSYSRNPSTYKLRIGTIQPKTLTETQQRTHSIGVNLIHIDRQILIGQLKGSSKSQWKQILEEHIKRQFQRCHEGEYVSNFEVRLRGEEISRCRLWLNSIEREEDPLNEIEAESFPVSRKQEELLRELSAHESAEIKEIPKEKDRKIKNLDNTATPSSQFEDLSILFFRCCLYQDFISDNAKATLQTRHSWLRDKCFYVSNSFQKSLLSRIANEYTIALQSLGNSLYFRFIQECLQKIKALKSDLSKFYPELSGIDAPTDLQVKIEEISQANGEGSERQTILGAALLDFRHGTNSAPSVL